MEATIATTDKKSGWYVELNNRPIRRVEISVATFETIVLERDNELTRDYLFFVFGLKKGTDNFDKVMKDTWLRITVTSGPDSISIVIVNDRKEIISQDTIYRPDRMFQFT